MLHGSSTLTSAETPERCHKTLVKAMEGCVSMSDMVKTLLRAHARMAMAEYVTEVMLDRIQESRADQDSEELQHMRDVLERMSKSTTPALLGIQWPILPCAMARDGLHMRAEVISHAISHVIWL
jgi:hypothetical protein